MRPYPHNLILHWSYLSLAPSDCYDITREQRVKYSCLSIVFLDPQMRQKRRQMLSQQKRNHHCYWSERWQWILRCWRHGQTRCWSTGCLIWRGYRGCCCWHRIHALLKGPTRWVLQRKWKWYNLGVMYVNWAACWLVHKRRCKSRV